MDSRLKLWVGIGAFTLVQAGLPALDPGDRPDAFGAAAAWAAQGGKGGEGGEGGEAGISAEDAARDPAAFLTALEVMAAHVYAGRDALAAGEATAAGEMFAHAISEIYGELEPVFQARGVVPFRERMEKASELALNNAPPAQIEPVVAEVLAALDAAAKKAPGKVDLGVEARVLGDLIDRAALQYAAARESKELEPYLDGYGFYMAAKARADASLARIAQKDRAAADAARAALASLGKLYPKASRPQNLAEAGPVLASASQAKLALQRLD